MQYYSTILLIYPVLKSGFTLTNYIKMQLQLTNECIKIHAIISDANRII